MLSRIRSLNRAQTSQYGSAVLALKALGPSLLLLPGDFIPNGGTISQWNDSSGNNRHATQATAVNQLSIVGNGAARSDGVGQWMRSAFAEVQPCSCFVRAKLLSLPAANTYLFGAGGVGANNGDCLINTLANVGIIAPTLLSASPAGPGANAMTTIGAAFNGASSIVRLNAVETSGAAGANNPGGITIGANGGASPGQFGNADHVMYVRYPFVPTLAQRDAIVAAINTICAGIT